MEYFSLALSGPSLRWGITDRECYAVVQSIKRFRPFMYGQKLVVRTDHRALHWLMANKDLNARRMCWSMLLQEHDFTIEYIKGPTNMADIFSRMPLKPHEVEPAGPNPFFDSSSAPRSVSPIVVSESAPAAESVTVSTSVAVSQSDSRSELGPEGAPSVSSLPRGEPTLESVTCESETVESMPVAALLEVDWIQEQANDPDCQALRYLLEHPTLSSEEKLRYRK